MELAELKQAWEEMSEKVKHQRVLTDKMIIDMTKIKFSNKINAILKYEGLGALVLLIAVFFLIFKIEVFNTIPLKIAAVVSILIMVGLPILSISSIYRMNNINMSKRTYKDTILEFTRRRSQFLLIQKWAVVFSVLLMFTIIPVTLKISKGEDFFAGDSNNLLWYAPIGLVIVLFFSRWGYNCYARITNDAKVLLEDLKDE